MRTHYSNLQVTEEAGPEVIRASYKALAQKWHPDRHRDNAKEAERIFKIITSAYEVLSDTKERAKYDAMLREERGASTLTPPSRSRPHPAAEAWRSNTDFGTAHKTTGAKKSAAEPHNDPHTPPTNVREDHPIFELIFNPPRSVVFVVLGIAWYFVFGKQWTIGTLFDRIFGL